MLSINSKTINRDLISLEINNIRNPQIKKMMRVVDDFYAQFLYNLSKKNKLGAYKHFGFWQCMDTLRDKEILEKKIKKA